MAGQIARNVMAFVASGCISETRPTSRPASSKKVSSDPAIVPVRRSMWRKPATVVGAPKSNSMKVSVPLESEAYSLRGFPFIMFSTDPLNACAGAAATTRGGGSGMSRVYASARFGPPATNANRNHRPYLRGDLRKFILWDRVICFLRKRFPKRGCCGTNECLKSRAFCARTLAGGPDGVAAHCSGHNEGFGVMHRKRLEVPSGAFHDGLPPLDQIKNVNAARSVVWHHLGEPMPARLDKVRLVKTRALIAPTWALRH